MAETVPTPAPNDAAAAYDTAVAAPVPASQPAAPDVGQNTPPQTAPVPIDAAAVAAKAAPFYQKEIEATQRGADIANKPVVDPTVPHAKLLAMIQAIGIGLSSFGAAAATGGREGGAPMVQKFQAGEQEMNLRGHEARVAEKNNQIQQQMTIADTNHRLAQSIILMSTLPTDLAMKDLQLSKEQTEVAGGKASLAQTQAEFMSTYGMNTEAFSTMMGGGAKGAAADPKAVQSMTAFAQQKIAAAGKILRSDDPYIVKAQQVLDNPQSTPQEIFGAVSSVNRQVGLQGQVQKARTEKETAEAGSPVAKLSTPEALAAPGAQAAVQAKISDPNTDPSDVARLKALLPRADMAQKNVRMLEEAKERAKQTITDGDPKAAGALLQSGLVSPSQLISSRKPQFAQAAFDEAIRLGGGVKGADGKWTGGTWSAVAAESQYDYAKNPKTQNTLNLLTTMQAPGGSIDIAKKEFNSIPGKVDEKTFNKIMTGGITEFGGTSVTNFHAAMVSLADEYAQVLQGGAATETTLQQAKDLIQQAYTKTQGAGAFDVISRDMAARQKGMVRDNPALMKMYPAPVESSGKSVSLAAAMALPINKGKTADQVRADIESHGHQVAQ